ncbi:MAG TPA: EamA family transporter [Treponemataceae bacterium]|nr:EamA family transporter [Treponemataceae bacterium]
MNSNNSERISAGALVCVLLVTLVWGVNFLVIKIGVQDVPPLFLVALRFAFSAFPAVFFVRRPNVSWTKLAAYGLLLGVGEFGMLFIAIKLGAPTGVSSIVMQSQVFFTALLAAFAFKEHIRTHSIAGMILAGIGLAIFIVPSLRGGSSAIALLPLSMILLSALFWAAANLVAQRMPGANGLSLMVWSSLFSPLPLLLLSWIFERDYLSAAVRGFSLVSLGSLAYLVILSTLFGYGVWNQMIMKHGAKRIAPFSLLVPVFGVAASALFMNEPLTPVSVSASLCILAGLAVHVRGAYANPKGAAPR